MKRFLLASIFCLTVINSFAQGIDKPKYTINTYRLSNFLGAIEIELYPIIAPLHVNNFDSLVAQLAYDSTAFHRVVPGFVIQGGDPNSISGPINTWGQGQPWQPTVNAEFNAVQHLRGTIGAARDTDPNSATSQFYICVGSPTYLDGNYTVYGRVTSGLNIVDSIALSPRNANDVPLQKISMFITANGANPAVPTVPQLLTPADSATSVENIQSFSWTAADSAVLYTIQFSTDSLFNTISWSDTIPQTQKTFPGMSGLTEYFWRVRSNNGGHESPWSTVRRFTSTTGAPLLNYPALNTSGIPINLNFVWNPVPFATSYRLIVATSPTFSISSQVFNQGGLTDTLQTVTGLQTNRVHYWKVQSENNGLPGMFSSSWYFTTGTSTGLEALTGNGLTLNGLYPNPAHDAIHLLIDADSKQYIELLILDVSGREFERVVKSLQQGKNELQIPVEKLQPGVYLLGIEIEGNSEYLRFVKE